MAYVICGQHDEPSVPIPLVYVLCFLKYKSKPLIKGKSTKVVFSKVLKVVALVEYSPESGPIFGTVCDPRRQPATRATTPPSCSSFCRSVLPHHTCAHTERQTPPLRGWRSIDRRRVAMESQRSAKEERQLLVIAES
jgi:hypothetical protein